ncbi:MAG: GNAT family N-acetyltransferase [Acidimicrobiia bacterium]|nr:GNAT family N-acetyltransferase [Acidimicrobiia bacterium]
MEIRSVRPEEHSDLADLTVMAYQQIGDLEDSYEPELRDVAGRVAGAEVLVCVDDDGALVGGVTFVPDHGSPYAEFDAEHAAGMRMLAVHPAAQGRGVGEALVLECIAMARAADRIELVLHTGTEMRAAHRIYERIGFVRDPNLDWWPTPSVELLGYRLHLEATANAAGDGGA